MLPGIGRIASLRRKKNRAAGAHACFANWAEPRASSRGGETRPPVRWSVASLQSHFLLRAEVGDEGRRKQEERVAMAPSEILKALSQGDERWPGNALEAASSQHSKVRSFLLEKLTQAVAEIERIEATGFPKPSLKRFLKAPSPLFYGVFLWRTGVKKWDIVRSRAYAFRGLPMTIFSASRQSRSRAIELWRRYTTATRNSFLTSFSMSAAHPRHEPSEQGARARPAPGEK